MKKLLIGMVAVMSPALCGCYGPQRSQLLFEAKAAPLRLEITYMGRSEATDGRVVLSWSHEQYGAAGTMLLYHELDFPEDPGIHDIVYDASSQILSMTVSSASGQKALRIPIIIPATHQENFVRENSGLLAPLP